MPAKSLILRGTLVAFLAIGLNLPIQIFSSSRDWGTSYTAGPAINRVELHQALLDLTNPWTVMCVAAHPDDEDGTTLTMLRRKYGIHTVSLFSTYGEGGQNAAGPELYQELGVIRARETMGAAEIQGSQPYFLGLPDFGFTKSAEETFRIWGEKEALRRMVLKIRELRPDVIITNHNTVSGHGQHQATGRLILEAFDAAADPNRFPEQLKTVSVWQPQRLFVRFGFDSNSVTKNLEQEAEKAGKVVSVNPNEKDPVRDSSFADQALAALQRHATQGPWPTSIAERLRAQNRTELPSIRYRLAREVAAAPALPTNAQNFVEGLRLPMAIGAKLAPPAVNDRPITDFADRPGEALVALIRARKAGLFAAPEETVKLDRPRFELMTSRLDRALAVASGVSMAITSNERTIVPGVESQFTVTLNNSGDADIEVKRLTFNEAGRALPVEIAEKLPPGTDTVGIVKVMPLAFTAVTVPASEHLYDDRFLGEHLMATAELEMEGARFELSEETREAVTPAVEITEIFPSPCVRTPRTLSRCNTVKLKLTNHLASRFEGQLKLTNSDLHAHNAVAQLQLEPHETREVTVTDKYAVSTSQALSEFGHLGSANVSINARGESAPITQRKLPVIYSDAKIVAVRVGYLPSFDRTLENSLAALGLDAKQLTVDDIRNADLTKFDSLIIDNRGYQAHPELIAANQRLLDFVKDGGTLIVFYHKTNEWNPDEKRNRPQLAPYSIILGDDRVTEEDAPIKILKPAHPLLTFPNRISGADFKDWIQERGLYYPKDWDAHYEALLATNDPGESPLNGGLLVAQFGKGNYIYTSMVWYRELMAGVPGSYRMLANMVSYGHGNHP
ncbi:MAG TPA: PIG-L family deacetylase [Pyrinomonadaceae bacterium]